MSNPTNEPQIYSADAELHGDGAEVTITLNASAVQLLLLRRRDAVGKVQVSFRSNSPKTAGN